MKFLSIFYETVDIQSNFHIPLKQKEKDLVFNCSIGGVSEGKASKLEWRRNGEEISEEDRKYFYDISVHDTVSSLRIKKPNIQRDSGNLSCLIKIHTDTFKDTVKIECEYLLFQLFFILIDKRVIKYL